MQDNENTLNPFRAVATVEGGSIGRQAAKLIEIGVCWAPWQGVDSVPEAM